MDDVQTLFRGDADSLESWLPLAEKVTHERFAAEREKIFRRSWLYLGKATDLTQPGSYFVKELPTLNASLIIVRGDDGKVRAFHNICRHRGNKLIRGGAGCEAAIRCGFHGWAFSNQGDCAIVTDEHQFPALDKSKLGLLAVACEVWNDFVFVNFDPRETLRGMARGYVGRLSRLFRAVTKKSRAIRSRSRATGISASIPSPRAITRSTSTGTRCRIIRAARATSSATARSCS